MKPVAACPYRCLIKAMPLSRCIRCVFIASVKKELMNFSELRMTRKKCMHSFDAEDES